MNPFLDNEEDRHYTATQFTPLRKDAFELSAEEKKEKIAPLFHEIMHILGLDMQDDSLVKTPARVAKAYVDQLFGGLLPENKPKVSTFANHYKYNQMLVEKDITVYSTCEHHFLPIIGKAHVAYISNGEVIGLSKINRIVNYYARRPQVQERLTTQIVNEMKLATGTEDVACIIDATHLCVRSRGIEDTSSGTITAELSGIFKSDPNTRRELMQYIGLPTRI